MTKKLSAAAFLLGAAVVLWMGAAFIGNNLLALLDTLAIGAVFAVGFAELLRYQQATATLQSALTGLNQPIENLDGWLQQLHPSLHNGVRLRIEGEHLGLPAPVLTPYLVGLLVMLGLLGTFVGMVDTLKGAVMALEGTTELEAIRAGLAAPIKGLGMAFGTSVAGVATSAMLGFVSTLSRRDRMFASRELDSKVSSVFQAFSLSYNRQQTFKAMQMQAQALPQVAEQLVQLADKLNQMSDNIGRQLTAKQEAFHQSVQGIYQELAASVGESLQQSLAASGRLAGESIQPVVKEIMQGIQAEAKATHQQLTTTAEQQLQSLTQAFSHTSEAVNQAWQQGLDAHNQANSQLITGMKETLDGFRQQFTTTSETLLQGFADNSSRLIEQQNLQDEQRLQSWVGTLENTQQAAISTLNQLGEQQATQFNNSQEQLQQLANRLSSDWQHASETSTQQQQQLAETLQQAASGIASSQQHQAEQLLEKITQLLQSSEELVNCRVETEANWLKDYNSRIETLSSSLTNGLNQLRTEEQQRGEAAVNRLGELQTAVTEHLSALGNALEAPMTRLIETASETPKAAAEVIEKLRSEISKNLERDNNLLEERRRIMEELNSLSGSMEQAASSQREAIEKMVTASASMLEEVAAGFTGQVGNEVTRLTDIIDHFSGSAAELASLGEAFGVAVELFSESNSQLLSKLESIETTLTDAGTRSDEQLAYYVAQAREIIDHSVMSQQELINQMRQLSRSGEVEAG